MGQRDHRSMGSVSVRSDPEGIVAFKSGSKKFRLFYGMRAMKAIELHYGLPFFKAIQSAMPKLTPEDMEDKAKIAQASANIQLTDVAKLFEVGLLKFQPDIEENDVDGLIDEIGLEHTSELIGNALAAALTTEEGDGSSGGNPPKASRRSRTGSRS